MAESGAIPSSIEETFLQFINQCIKESARTFYSSIKSFYEGNLQSYFGNTNNQVLKLESLNQQFIKNFKQLFYSTRRKNSQITRLDDIEYQSTPENFVKLKIVSLGKAYDLITDFQSFFKHLLDQDEFSENEFILEQMKNKFIEKFDQLYEMEDKELVDLLIYVFEKFSLINQDNLRTIHNHHKSCFDEGIKSFAFTLKKIDQISDQEYMTIAKNSIKLFRIRVKNTDKTYKKLTDDFVKKLETYLNERINSYKKVSSRLVDTVYDIFCLRFDEFSASNNKNQDQLKVIHNSLAEYCLMVLRELFTHPDLLEYLKESETDFAHRVSTHFEQTFDAKDEQKLEGFEYFDEFTEFMAQVNDLSDLNSIHGHFNELMQGSTFDQSSNNLLAENRFNIEQTIEMSKQLDNILNEEIETCAKPDSLKMKCKDIFTANLKEIKDEHIIFVYLKLVIQVIQQNKLKKYLNEEEKIVNDFIALVESKFILKLRSQFLPSQRMQDEFENIKKEVNYKPVLEKPSEGLQNTLQAKLDSIFLEQSEIFTQLYHNSSQIISKTKVDLVKKYKIKNCNKFRSFASIEQFETYVLGKTESIQKDIDEKLVDLRDKFESSFYTKIVVDINEEINQMFNTEKQKYQVNLGQILNDSPIAPVRTKKLDKFCQSLLNEFRCDFERMIIEDIKKSLDVIENSCKITIIEKFETCYRGDSDPQINLHRQQLLKNLEEASMIIRNETRHVFSVLNQEIEDSKLFYERLMQISIAENMINSSELCDINSIHKDNKKNVEEHFNDNLSQIIPNYASKYRKITVMYLEQLMSKLDKKMLEISCLLTLIKCYKEELVDTKRKENYGETIDHKAIIINFIEEYKDKIGGEKRFMYKLLKNMTNKILSLDKIENQSKSTDDSQHWITIQLWHKHFYSKGLDINIDPVQLDDYYCRELSTNTEKGLISNMRGKLMKITLNHETLSKVYTNKAVLTIPMRHTKKLKETIQCARSVGLVEVHLLNQLDAAAIGYAFDENTGHIRPGIFILIIVVYNQDYHCGIYHSGTDKVELKFYLEQQVESSSNPNLEQELNQEHLKNFIINFNEIWDKFNKVKYDSIMIAGQSNHYSQIKSTISSYLMKDLVDVNPIDILVKGSVHFAEKLTKKVDNFEIIKKTENIIRQILF